VFGASRFRQFFDFLSLWLAVAIPGLAALQRVAWDSVWRDDLPLVRGLGLVAPGGPSTLTTVAMQLASLFPLGPLPFRAALISALALSICSTFVFLMARGVLETHVPGSFLNAPLAGVAALSASLGPGLQAEATVGGGATVPLAAGLAALWAITHPQWSKERRHGVCAILSGALLTESALAALVVLLACAVSMVLRKDWPGNRREWIAWGLWPLTVGVLMMPAWFRPLSPNSILNYGRDFSMAELAMVDPVARPATGLAAWKAEVGVVSLVIAVLGGVMGLVRKRTRWLVAPWLLVVAADAVFPASHGGVLTVDQLTALRSFAIVAIAMLASVGVQTVVTTLTDTALPMAKAAAVLLVLFDGTLVAVTAENAAFSVDRSVQPGASAYTDQALYRIDPNAMVLVRSHAIIWRLLASQVVAGARPDVVVVPFPLMGRGTVAAGVLAHEPAATMMLRDMALEGTAGPHAVSRVSDRRRLLVELDPAWKDEMAVHLKAEGLWLSMETQPLGRSDRRLAAENAGKVIERVAKAASSQPADEATQSVLLTVAKQQTLAAALAKDRQVTYDLLQKMAAVAPQDLFVRALKQRMEHAKGATIDVSGLIR
jgi:hypothetical protein